MAQKAEGMMSLAGKRQRDKGFLLLEIMMSVSILSIGVLLILNSFVKLIKATELSEDYFRAGLLLEEKLTEVYNGYAKEGLSKGEFKDPSNRFSWELYLAKSEDDSCREVSLKVLWREKDKEEDLSVSTCI